VRAQGLDQDLIKNLQKDERTVRQYRDWFDVDAQYAQQERRTTTADVDFHREFVKYNHHAQTIINCRRSIARIENTYTEALKNKGNQYWEYLKKAKMTKQCEAVRRSAHELVLHLDTIIKKPRKFQPHKVYDRLRSLTIVLQNWRRELQDQKKAEESARQKLFGG